MGAFKLISVIGLLTVSLTVFQNCGGPLEEQDLEGDTTSAFATVEENLAVPFAFDTVVNRLAYNSCQKYSGGTQDLPAPTFFNFRVSAVQDSLRGDGGVQIRQEFLNHIQATSKLKKDERLPVEMVRKALSASYRNANSKLQLGLHSTDSLRAPAVPSGGSEGEAIHRILPALTTTSVMDLLLSQGVNGRVSFFPMAPLVERSLAASINGFYSSEVYRQRTSLGSREPMMLVLGYTGITDVETLEAPGPRLRSFQDYDPSASEDLVYARGFQFNYESSARPLPGYPNNPLINRLNVVASVREMDLTRNLNDRIVGNASWNCPVPYRFRVYRFEDSTHLTGVQNLYYLNSNNQRMTHVVDGTSVPIEVYKCPRYDDMLDVAQANPVYRQALEEIRSVLPAEHWYVHIPFAGNPFGGEQVPACAIPRMGECYPRKASNRDADVVYRDDVPCGGANFYCSEFISVCLRTQLSQ